MGKATKKKAIAAQAKLPNYSVMLLQAKDKAHLRKEGIKSFDPMSAISGYGGYALRSLEAFTPKTRSLNTSTRVRELIRYAFNKYNPPAFLYQVWDPDFKPDTIRIFPDIREDFKLWYIAAAQGKSLYKEHTMGLLTKRETFYLSTCQHALTIAGAIWYSVIRCIDETKPAVLARNIASTKLSGRPLDDFWKGVARWFMNNETTIRQMNDLLDYITNRHQQNAEWHLKDMTLTNLIKHMEIWHREMYRVGRMSRMYTSWEGLSIPDSIIERGMGKAHIKWRFHQITTGKELAEEGNKQHHCVSSYGLRCAQGQCSIWSLTQWNMFDQGTHALTIEVTDGAVVQARGYANRLAKNDELSVMKEWASKCNFRVRTY